MTKRKRPLKGVALYHDMRWHEGFDETARILFDITKKAADEEPGVPRTLILDVQEHRDEAGGFDPDALEVMKEFLFGILMPYLTEAHTPLGSYRNAGQSEDFPDELTIRPAEGD